jgi:hypothetical protein
MVKKAGSRPTGGIHRTGQAHAMHAEPGEQEGCRDHDQEAHRAMIARHW